MGFFKKLTRRAKEMGEQLERENTQRSSGGLSSLFGNLQKKKPIAVRGPRYDNVGDFFLGERGSGTRSSGYMLAPKIVAAQPAPTGIEALINPMRTDPGGQEDMRRLMDMQRQTFRSFLAPPQETTQALPITGQDLGLPMGPGTPAPGGVIFEPEVGNIDIQEILDNLPTGVTIGGGLGSIPVPNIPIQLPQIDDIPQIPQIPIMPLAPQIPIMPSFDVAPMPAMRLPRVRPDTKGLPDF